MSDTPKTDWAETNEQGERTGYVRASFCRQLERELAAEKLKWQITDEALRASCDEVAALKLRLAEAQRDAARYRWLRDHAESIKYSGCHVVRATAHCLDASVDIAMKEKP